MWKKGTSTQKRAPAAVPVAQEAAAALADGQVVVFTDGACKGNPGPGGWAAVMRFGEHAKELSGGYRHTTNNRMELMGVIEALRSLKRPSRVTVFSDSSYVVQGITQGWALSWRRRGWKKSDGHPAENIDLWQALLAQLETHTVRFVWLRGHAGHADNERCDALAVSASLSAGLGEDVGYRK